MKLYQLTFMDIERGKIRRWKRNKREISRFVRAWKKEFPLRQLILTEVVEIPDNKSGHVVKQQLVVWLNANCGGE